MSCNKHFQERPTWAEINLDALANNFKVVKDIVGRDVAVMAVVKANAYGHGATACARRLAREGVHWFGVAILEEAITLRESGITDPILLLSGIWSGQEEACIKYHLTPVVYRFDRLKSLERVARAAKMQIDVHIKIDTGMGRLGIRAEKAREFADQIKKQIDPALIRIDGLMTHFAAADDPAKEEFTAIQVDKFQYAVKVFHDRGFNPTFKDLANTPGIYTRPDARENMVRAGGILYGLWRDVLPASFTDTAAHLLQPVMTLRTRICLLKDVPAGWTVGYGCTFKATRTTRVATLPIGYHDGYPRGLSNIGHVIVRGVLAPVIGRVSMDLTTIDVTEIPNVEEEEAVTLIGCDGDLEMSCEEIARRLGRFSYELTCGVSDRVPRIYTNT